MNHGGFARKGYHSLQRYTYDSVRPFNVYGAVVSIIDTVSIRVFNVLFHKSFYSYLFTHIEKIN